MNGWKRYGERQKHLDSMFAIVAPSIVMELLAEIERLKKDGIRIHLVKPDGTEISFNEAEVVELRRRDAELKATMERNEKAFELLREVAACGVSYQAKRYAEVQIDNGTLAEIKATVNANP